MKLVARLGAAPAPTPHALSRKARREAGRTAAAAQAAAAARTAPVSPALEAASGRELLQATRELLSGLARCARPE
jgi:transcription-repair coupling factor (superfamily II helicase)